MLEAFVNIFKIPELKKKVLFTLGALAIYRLGSHIPTPGIDAHALNEFFKSQAGGILGLLDLFSGGAFRTFSVCALGIMPYISTSIIMQLLTAVIPALERLAKEGDIGRKKITQYTRYGTVVLCAIQGFGMTYMMHNVGKNIVINWGLSFQIMTVLTLTTGTMFLMWLGEQITERGIGNGISMLIFAGIVARVPQEIINTTKLVLQGELSLFLTLFVLTGVLALVAFVVFIEAGNRKIPVQYAQRIVGRRVYGGQSTYLPLKVNHSGVIAIIFASSVVMFPATIAKFITNNVFTEKIAEWLSPGAFLHETLYFVLIVFFCYFYTAIVFNPVDIAENIKKYGGFIPGVRPGQPTAEFIDKILTRVTLVGALAVVIIAIVPDIVMRKINIPFYFGGTSLLIVVGVAMDTMKQIESHLLMRHYEGFMKQGKIKSRGAF
ncbi:MAG: preprotein translocase subunit SecY [Candidatus Firestonebacteria bacterium]